MKTVVSRRVMRDSDLYTTENSVPTRSLIKAAGEGIFGFIKDRPGNFAIVCGGGNNAGDGYVVASLLANAGRECRIFMTSDRFSPDGYCFFDICRKKGIPHTLCDENCDFSGFDNIIDCIYGTGFRGEVSGIVRTVIEKINSSGAFVVSVDINSALDSDSGLSSLCVISDLTVSIGFYKTGHFLNMAKDCIKKLVNVNPGIELHGNSCALVENGDFASIIKSRRNFSHKGDYGYVALIGGSVAFSGAPRLSAMSAACMRVGAGVVKLAVPSSVAYAIMPGILESTLFPLEEKNGFIAFNRDQAEALLSRVGAIGIGMGAGMTSGIADYLSFILSNYRIPVVIDADGIAALSSLPAGLSENTGYSVILTPHLGEFARLTGLSVEDIQKNPVEHACRYAAAHRVVLLLKGPATIVTDGERTYIVSAGCPGMATAGSGDLLTGIIVGLLGYNPPDPLTVACGAFIAGKAGELAESRVNCVSMVAGDTLAALPEVVGQLLDG